MKKILLIMLLFLIFIVNIVNAEKYQVSCDLIFDNSNVFCEIWDHLDDKKSLGFQKDIKDSGDRIFPSRKSIDLLKEQDKILVPIKKSYRLNLRLRLDNRDERDDIWFYLLSQKPFVASKTPGCIEKHICRHDEGESCTQSENESWCQEIPK